MSDRGKAVLFYNPQLQFDEPIPSWPALAPEPEDMQPSACIIAGLPASPLQTNSYAAAQIRARRCSCCTACPSRCTLTWRPASCCGWRESCCPPKPLASTRATSTTTATPSLSRMFQRYAFASAQIRGVQIHLVMPLPCVEHMLGPETSRQHVHDRSSSVNRC